MAASPTVRLALDYSSSWCGDRTLVIGAPRAGFELLEKECGNGFFFSCDQSAPASAHGSWYSSEHDAALVFLPKGKQRREMWLRMAVASLTPGAKLAVVGHRKEGIKGVRKELARWCKSTLSEHGHHCQIHSGALDSGQAAQLDDFERRWDLGTQSIVSFPGVFADGRLDPGSQLLIEALEQAEVEGQILDLACGAGVVGLSMTHRPIELTLADVDHLAVEAVRRSLALREHKATVIASDIYRSVSAKFDHIAVNPPFHQGVRTRYDIAEQMLRKAPDFLRAGGTLWVVANRFLPYRDILEECFSQVRIARETSRFRVWQASLESS